MSTLPSTPPSLLGRAQAFFAARGDGFWAVFLAVLGLLIYIPWLGSFPLWDPWEPHYAQVAWEMQERLTWNNPWYRGIDNWWSKPILMLWMLRATLGMFWDPLTDFANNEWIVRTPFALAAVAGAVLHFDWVRRLFGRTVGVVAGVALLTAPQYLLIGRQVMVDTIFVITYAAALGYLAVGLFTARPAVPARVPPDAPAAARRTRLLLLFWGALTAATIVTGLAPAISAGLLWLVAYAATFRWADHQGFLGTRPAWRYTAVRGGASLAALAAAWGVGELVLRGGGALAPAIRAAVLDVTLLGVGLGLFYDFPLARHAWRLLAACRAQWGVPILLGGVGLASLVATLKTGRTTLGVDLIALGPSATVVDVLFNPILWTIAPWLVLIADKPLVGRLRAWLAAEWPFVAFWALAAISVLAKGFVTPTLVVMIVLAYWLATFRWQDYAPLVAGRDWSTYLLVRGAIALLVAGAAFALAWYVPGASREERGLYQALIAVAAGLCIALGLLHDLPFFRHALHLLSRMRAGWGVLLFFAVAAPWYVYMSVEHGWPYWNEFIYYHHLGRAAGTIDKPGGTFDYVVRQTAFAVFPWTAFIIAALWRFVSRSSAMRSIAERRNLFLLLSVLLPYLFFSLSGTKFAHYIFPVVPPLTVMLAAALVWMGRHAPARLPLAEVGLPLGPAVEAHVGAETPFWQRPGARGDLLVFAAVALVVFGILAHDLVLDFRHFLRLFIYYYNRETPFDYQPFIILQVFFFPIGIVVGLLLFSRWVCHWHIAAFSLGAVVVACYLGWVTMPAMGDTFSYKPFYGAYQSLAKAGEPIGQYNDWQQPERSVIFLFQNRCVHLRNDNQAKVFLQRAGRKFVIVDRDRLADLRRVAKEAELKLYVVFDGHPYARLVSDQPNPQDSRKAVESILTELPSGVTPIDADFEGKIRMVGWTVEPPVVKPGESVTVSFYYRAQQVMDRDWQIFVHGDGPQGGSNRIHVDHFPLDGLYPTTEWQEGEIIRDRFVINVGANYPFDYFYLWTGWYIGNQRLRLANNPPNDGQNRVRGPRIQVQRD